MPLCSIYKLDISSHSKSIKCKDISTNQYGQLVILGYNGSLSQGDKGRRRSKFSLYQHLIANGVKESKQHTSAKDFSQNNPSQFRITYKLDKEKLVIVEYERDRGTDLYQIGRSSESSIDFVVLDTIIDKPGRSSKSVGFAFDTIAGKPIEGQSLQSTISRFACRIICERENPEICRIYAAGFDETNNIFLGEKAVKWVFGDEKEIDGLTSNGVLVMHPDGDFCGGNAVCKPWREVSVGGAIFSLREHRSNQEKGVLCVDESNILQDGTLIDLCGATLLWRTFKGLQNSPTKKDLKKLVEALNSDKSNYSPELATPLIIPYKNNTNSSEKINQPYTNFHCGHVFQDSCSKPDPTESTIKICPICHTSGSTARLCMGIEPAFYVDNEAPMCAFNPCGHMTTEKTANYWSLVGIPHGTNGFEAMCPFCATPLQGCPGYIRLIFQNTE